MTKAFVDLGAAVQANKPVRLPVRDPREGLPDPALCLNGLIVVNDPTDGMPRGRLALSNGATWDLIAYADELGRGQTVDVTPMIREAVREAMPAMLPAPMPQQALAAPAPVPEQTDWAEDRKLFSQALLEMAETINELQRRVHFLEHNALAADGTTVETQGRAA